MVYPAGSTSRVRSMHDHRPTTTGAAVRAVASAPTRASPAEVAPLFDRVLLRPVVDSTFDLADIRAAHERLASNETFGKVVLRVTGAGC